MGSLEFLPQAVKEMEMEYLTEGCQLPTRLSAVPDYARFLA